MRGTPFLLEGFVGGLNSQDSPYTLLDSETRECLNVVSTERGSIKKRGGSVVYTETQPAVELDSMAAVTISGTSYLIIAGGGKIWSVTGTPKGKITEIGKGFSLGIPWQIIEAHESKEVASEGPVYMQNGKDKAQYWTGTGEVKEWTGKTPETALKQKTYTKAPHVPQGLFMIYNEGRVIVSGIEGDESAVRFSEIVAAGEGGGIPDPSSWPEENVVRFDPEDGNPITGIGKVGPYTLVFKKRKTWVVTNVNFEKVRKLSDTIGCISHRSITETSQGTFFLTADQGIYATDGNKLTEMSYKVRPTILAVNSRVSQQAAGAYYQNHYYLSFPSGTSVVNNKTLDYDFQLKSWWLHDLAPRQWAVYETEHIGPGAGVGKTTLYGIPQKLEAGVVECFVPEVYTDSGKVYTGANNLSAFWLSPWNPFSYFIFRHRIKAPFIKKRVRQIFFDGEGEIIPVVAKNFTFGGTEEAATVGAKNAAKPEFPTNFGSVEQIFGNENTGQLFAGEEFEGVLMFFGGSSSVQAARIYSPGVGRTWSVGWGNNSEKGFVVHSYAMMIQFRKS